MPSGAMPHAAARLVAEWRYFLAALAYFTRVPIPLALSGDARARRAAMRYWPLVGALVGAVGAAVLLGAARLWPPSVAVGLSLAATLGLTGALHEDGLADCCDGLGGGDTRDDVLRIMRDSRLGTFGVLGLLVVLGLKWQLLAALPPARAAVLLCAAHAASRACALSVAWRLDYAHTQGKARPLAKNVTRGACAFALATGLPGLCWLDWSGWPSWLSWLSGWRGRSDFLPLFAQWAGPALLMSLLAALRALLRRWLRRRIGGYTGDCLGFTQQVFELTIYLTFGAWTGS